MENVFDNPVTIPEPDVIPLRNLSYQCTSLNNLWDKSLRLQFSSLLVVFVGMWYRMYFQNFLCGAAEIEDFQVTMGKILSAFFTTGGKVSGSWKSWNFISTSLIPLSSNAQFTAACSSKMLGPLT